MQTKIQSLIEVAISYTIGFLVALATQSVVSRLFGLGTTVGQDIGITVVFTAVSIVRSYLVRRWFNKLHGR